MLTIARITFREMLREKYVHIVIFISILLFLFSLVLGSLSFDEQTRIVIHLGLAAIQLSIVGIAIFIGTSLIVKEIERQTCLIVLARPITRVQFYVGKYLGALGINFVICLILVCILWIFSENAVGFLPLLLVVLGSFFESSILLATSLFLSLIMRPAVALFSSIGIFIIGNWLEELVYFANKSKNPLFESFAKLVHNVFPQLYRTNWRSFHIIQNHLLTTDQVGWVIIHSLGWTILLVGLGTLIFRRKDLV